MTKLTLKPDGYERIMEKIQSVEDALNRAFFEPGAASRCLREASGKLYELRHTLHEVIILKPGVTGPSGPSAA
jgi:hypothetical protein